MTHFNVNTSYFMHSTPEYNKKHKEEISKYNAEYYENNKEKWQDNDEDSSKSGSSEDDEKDSKDKKSGSDSKKSKEDKIKSILGKLNGGSKKGGSATGKSSSKKSNSSTKKSKETDEEKKKREEEEKAEKERQSEEERTKNSEAAEKYNAILEANAKYIEEHQQGKKKSKPNVRKSNSAVKHSAVYVGINSQPYFEHHGRLGMKWGKRNGPPYPLDYSKLSEEERAKDKARVKEEGDIESVAYKKNRSYFTDQEINDVINRYQLNTRINQLSADSAKMKAGKSKTQELADNMAKVADVGNKLSNALSAGTNVYNNVAKIMNAFGDNDLPIIGQQKQKESPFNKLGKKELDKAINDIEKNMGKYSTKELQELNQRKNTLNLLTKERDEKRAADKVAKDAENLEKAKKEVEDYNRNREAMDKIANGVYRQASKVVKDYVDNKSDDIEHVTGEVVDAGHQWFNDNYLAIEDKQRR